MRTSGVVGAYTGLADVGVATLTECVTIAVLDRAESGLPRHRRRRHRPWRLPRYLSFEEHQALGVFIAWYPAFTHEVMYAALWDFMQDFQARGLAAWEAFEAGRQGRPYPHPRGLASGEITARQRELEARYYAPALLEKYRRASGHDAGS